MYLSKVIGKIKGYINTKRVYERVIVDNLSSEELRETGIPDDYLAAIWVEFMSPSGRIYDVAHANDKKVGFWIWKYPLSERRLQLYGHKLVDTRDFESVESKIAEIVNGNLSKIVKEIELYEEDTSKRRYGLSRIIDVSEKFTQAAIANFVDEYINNFREVAIQHVRFNDVPRYVYANSQLHSFHREKTHLYTKYYYRIPQT